MTIHNVQGVKVVHWNPLRGTTPRPLRALGIGDRVENFGDVMGPAVVERSLDAHAPVRSRTLRRPRTRRLLSIGSIMHMARTGDVIWGTGVNGKVAESAYRFAQLDVRAVRGPLTRQWLLARNINVPEVYGDPALLTPALFPEFAALAQEKRHHLTIVPNFHDYQLLGQTAGVIDPRGEFRDVISHIVQSEQVIASSLHGVILAEAFGIPVAAMKSSTEPSFKYLDYFEGTGRTEVPVAETVEDAKKLLASRHIHENPLAAWVPKPLQQAFPIDLWRSGAEPRSAV
ncbi:polysaccharide pyruvyl transferase family protein [Microbacterium saperdae]|uniref:Pyruvyl transferase n=1 Tax=Microbacterium saperdae TaxID=69368 RepID=A0A543BQN3_9MICO|nr:polysaccharide pyruvyl transferase family protein [Microbacterium saperdae]TQL87139.1 pyruvyl transferase [Microbacterium saperdae]GGM42588.1 hypothetical protein GCM10010489_12100 [Microbacterium saperdae]